MAPRIGYLSDWIGGRTRTRTLDPLIKSQLLYQLSYAPGSTAVARERACLYQSRIALSSEPFPAIS